MYKEKVQSSHEKITRVIYETPLAKSNDLSKKYNSNIYYKCENLQTIGAFKIRGAANKILSYIEKNPKIDTLYAASSGNHASGVARMAQFLNIDAVIYVASSTPDYKKNKIKKYGAKLVEFGDSYDDAYKEALKNQKLHKNSLFVHPFDDEDVLIGNGTIAYEILKVLPKVDNIIVPIGGGGLISGIAKYAKEVNPKIKIIGVEPINNPSMKKSVEKGSIEVVNFHKTLADGVNVLEVSETNRQVVEELVDQIVLVSEQQIKSEMQRLLINDKLVVEGAGALSVAALNNIYIKEDEKYVCLLSGGNVDPKLLSELIQAWDDDYNF